MIFTLSNRWCLASWQHQAWCWFCLRKLIPKKRLRIWQPHYGLVISYSLWNLSQHQAITSNNIDIWLIRSQDHILQCFLWKRPGPCLNIKTVFPGMGIPMIKIRLSRDRRNMGFPTLVRQHLYIEKGPWIQIIETYVKTIFLKWLFDWDQCTTQWAAKNW